ncbi:MAG: hypothetical protein CMO80_10650 [Verrucomicrobiales bacterium]|nr:hypothetical protein [Verrucomicrobiales bacterium]
MAESKAEESSQNPVGEPDSSNPDSKRRGRDARSWLIEWVIALLLGAIVSAAWVVTSNMTSAEKWNIPQVYEGDGISMLTWIKAAKEGDYHFFGLSFVERLGAPFDANWNDYPMPEKPFTLYLGYLARLIGVIAAANASILSAHVLATMAFYLVCRRFRWCRWWSAVGAIVFGLQHYIVFRGQPHILMALIYTLPAAISVVYLVFGSKRMESGSKNRLWCIGVSFWMGISNPYFLNVFLQLLIMAVGLNICLHRRRENLVTAGMSFGSSVFGFLVSNNSLFLMMLFAGTGANTVALQRKVSEAEIYGLRPIELFLPPTTHRWELFSGLGEFYKSQQSYQQPETLSPYIGIIGIIALLCLIFFAGKKMIQNKAHSVPLAFLFSGWVLLYSTVGGMNHALALAGIKTFRATNRYSVFIITMVLLWAVSRLHLKRRRWPFPLQAALGVAIVAFAIADQLPHDPRAENRERLQKIVDEDRDFGRLIESELPEGAMVFQMPALDFPEGGGMGKMRQYEPLRPYMNTSKVKFSFGSNRGRMDAVWQHYIERLPPRAMVNELRNYGFHGIVIHRKAYTRPDRLLTVLAQLGLQPRAISNEHDFVFVPLLQPNPQPQLPDLDQLTIASYGKNWTRLDVNADQTLWSVKWWTEIGLNPAIAPGEVLHVNLKLASSQACRIKCFTGKLDHFEEVMEARSTKDVSFNFTVPMDAKYLQFRAYGKDKESDADKQLEFGVNRIQITRLAAGATQP